MTLNWNKIQDKWQKAWEKAELGNAEVNKNKEKFFMIFAYPGISGYLHVGHMRGFSYTDAICRYERLKGKEVLFPLGTHASGNSVIAFANKVKNKDENWINYLKDNGCPPEKIKELSNPKKVIEFFNKVYVEEYWKKFGFISDWDRFICTSNPDYEKFIQWQFKKLYQKNLLVQKPYFATACIEEGPVAVDPSETDISKGGNAEKQEYTLLKFKLGKDYLVAATLRPETIFGQTNLWINPEAEYVRVNVEGESWIISKEAAEKLSYQKDEALLGEDINPRKLIGRKVIAPGINREIPVLPAKFCDPKRGTGIVTSVPSDAPYDYVALKSLQNCINISERYNIEISEIKKIKLIPIINSKGYGKLPAQEIVDKLRINSLDDPRLEDATKEVYKAGYHSGVMLENAGKYTGKRVEEAKELIKAELIEQGKADIFYDLSEEVICRCGKKVIIKRIDDQWFIKYSDQELTIKSQEHIKSMTFFPEEYKSNMPKILSWFSDRACVRQGNWIGSKFPFDEQWIIEPISDSTLYPAYYVVAKYYNNGKVKLKDLTEEFFDYVFLGKGSGKADWKEIKAEFDYFYPLDINLGGKEHQTVHFPVFIMNHVAILNSNKWPQGIFVNWWVTGKAGKISKSKGGAQPIPLAIEKYGVDAMRLYYAHIGSPHTDVVWDKEVVYNYKLALEKIYSSAQALLKPNGKKKSIDQWMLSRLNANLKAINEAMKSYDLRILASIAYFVIPEDLKWYLRRGGDCKETSSKILSVWAKLLNPITPHLSEEINLSKDLVSASNWPEVDEKAINLTAEAEEEMLKRTIDGARKVLKLAKIEQPKEITLFLAEKWLYELFGVLSREIKVTRNMGEIMKKILANEVLKSQGKEVGNMVASVLKDVSKLPHLVISQDDEIKLLKEAKPFLEEEFSCSIKIITESSDPKAKSAMPGRVGILVK